MTEKFRTVSIAGESVFEEEAVVDWEQSQLESEEEYKARKQAVDLSRMVDLAIEQELSDVERKVIEGRYFDKRTNKEIAGLLGVSPTAVAHAAKRAEEKLERVLRYVVQYRENALSVPTLPIAIREAMGISAAKRFSADTFGSRLQKFRCIENLSPAELALATDSTALRIAALESGEALPDPAELIRLSAFFGITTDQMLKG